MQALTGGHTRDPLMGRCGFCAGGRLSHNQQFLKFELRFLNSYGFTSFVYLE